MQGPVLKSTRTSEVVSDNRESMQCVHMLLYGRRMQYRSPITQDFQSGLSCGFFLHNHKV